MCAITNLNRPLFKKAMEAASYEYDYQYDWVTLKQERKIIRDDFRL